MTSHYDRGSVTTLHDLGGVLGRPSDHFLLGSHNFMDTALGSCVKWPLEELKVSLVGVFFCHAGRLCKHEVGLFHIS
jgi:hypothetical protein